MVMGLPAGTQGTASEEKHNLALLWILSIVFRTISPVPDISNYAVTVTVTVTTGVAGSVTTNPFFSPSGAAAGRGAHR